jgi:hypothetical protein
VLWPEWIYLLSFSFNWSSIETFFPIFIRIYSLYGGIHCNNFEQPYIAHWLDCSHHLPPYPLPALLYAIARDSILYVYMKHAHHIPSPSPPSFTLPHLPQVPTYTHYTYFAVLSFIINSGVNVHRGFLMCPCWECTLLWSVQLLSLLSLTPFLAWVNLFYKTAVCSILNANTKVDWFHIIFVQANNHRLSSTKHETDG